MTFLPKDDIELDFSNEKSNNENSTSQKKSLFTDKQFKKLHKIANEKSVKESRKKDNKANYEENKEKILQYKRELYKKRNIARNKLKKEIEKLFETIPKDLLIVDSNSINIKHTKYKITYNIRLIP
jgi:hypothetical protein